jgi:hypothetical protein
LKSYLQSPGDGRQQARIPATALVWALLIGALLRRVAFAAIEALVCSPARRALQVGRSFGNDALNYFTERLDPQATRQAVITALHQAKRHKAFDDCPAIGLALDGTGAGRSQQQGCELCRPVRNQQKQTIGYHHKLVMISVVGVGLTLAFDIEPYGSGDSEYSAGRRLLRRAVGNLGRRFADYVVADGDYATAPFLHDVGDLGLFVVARLKSNLPELFSAAQKRFARQAPHQTFWEGQDRVEIWDADDFDPWTTLRWETVRVVRYRQHKPDGGMCEAYWLTDFPRQRVSSRSLFRMAKSRWEIENQGFNDAKNRYGFEHICHHQRNSLLLVWLLTCLAMTIERLYRIRYLHRGTHPILEAIDLWQILWLSLSCPVPDDTS